MTAAKLSPAGKALWGKLGVQTTKGSATNSAPKIAGTSDGLVVVAWTSNSNVVLQKLDANGHAVWGKGIVLREASYNYLLADLHAADNGSVIVSRVREQGFGSNSYIYANKLSATGKLLWGKGHVKVFDNGSLQFGAFPYFVPDGSGGAVFASVYQHSCFTVLRTAYPRQRERSFSPQRVRSLNQYKQRKSLACSLFSSGN